MVTFVCVEPTLYVKRAQILVSLKFAECEPVLFCKTGD